MLDLRSQAAIDYLAFLDLEQDANAWPLAVRDIEQHRSVAGLLEELGEELDGFAKDDMALLCEAVSAAPVAGEMRAVLAQLGAARLFRVLCWLDESPDADPQRVILALTEGRDPSARALRAAIGAFARRVLLGRLFAPERIEAVCAAARAALRPEPVR